MALIAYSRLMLSSTLMISITFLLAILSGSIIPAIQDIKSQTVHDCINTQVTNITTYSCCILQTIDYNNQSHTNINKCGICGEFIATYYIPSERIKQDIYITYDYPYISVDTCWLIDNNIYLLPADIPYQDIFTISLLGILCIMSTVYLIATAYGWHFAW